MNKASGVAALAALTCTAALVAAPAAAEGPVATREVPATVTVLTTGLSGPRQLTATSGRVYVAESDSGEVTGVSKRTGRQTVVVRKAYAAQGAVRTGGKLYVTSGAPAPDADPAPPPGTGVRLLVARPAHKAKPFADLLAYERRHNPDHQTQLGADGAPLDTLSNPYAVVLDRAPGGFLLVADAGANDVLAVSRKGKVSTFFVPPSVTTGACADVENNSDAGNSCDSVPTGLAYGPDGNLYVSALTSQVAGEGRVYVVDRRGKLVRTITGLSSPTGVAVDGHGVVYVSEALQGAPAGPPPSGFDPASVGQVVKIAENGTRTYAQVTQPTGLLWSDGRLYASAWSLSGPTPGQVVVVHPSSFRAG